MMKEIDSLRYEVGHVVSEFHAMKLDCSGLAAALWAPICRAEIQF
jgi:hypothetical protein